MKKRKRINVTLPKTLLEWVTLATLTPVCFMVWMYFYSAIRMAVLMSFMP